MRHDSAPVRSFSVASFLTLAASLAGGAESPTRPDWGTKDQILTRIGFTDFVPYKHDMPYLITGFPPTFHEGISSTDGFAVFYASVHIPSGARLTYFELDLCIADAAIDSVTLALDGCASEGNDCHLIKELTSADSEDGCGIVSSDLTPLNYVVDNNTRQLRLIAFLERDGSGQPPQLNGAAIGYRLQIGPAPATATFGDVPTTHLYFRAIEALAASGITAGCGSGNFCPSQNVTRGEMAAFLARALGLHFPN